MADLNTRTDSFISMVLSVNGRVRPVDLSSVPEQDRTALLQAYAQAHGASQPLHFQGDTLVAGLAGPAPATPPMPAPAVAPPTPAEPATQAAVPTPPPGAAAFIPAPPPGATAVPMPPESLAEPSVGPGEARQAGSADASSFEAPPAVPPPADLAPPAASSGDVAPPATPGDTASPVAPPAVAQKKASWLFWLLPIFFTWLGGLVAWLVVRKENAKQARAMLLGGIILTLVYFAIAFALFGSTFGALFNSSPLNQKLPSLPAKTTATTSTPAPSNSTTAPAKKK